MKYTVLAGSHGLYKEYLKLVLQTDENGQMIASEMERQDFKAVYSTVFP